MGGHEALEALQLSCQEIALAAEVATWRVIYARTGDLPKENYLRQSVLAEANDRLTREALYEALKAELDACLRD